MNEWEVNSVSMWERFSLICPVRLANQDIRSEKWLDKKKTEYPENFGSDFWSGYPKISQDFQPYYPDHLRTGQPEIWADLKNEVKLNFKFSRIEYEGRLMLLEIAQVPPDYVDGMNLEW